MNKPIDFSARKAERAGVVGAEAHRKGEAFAFAPYEYDDDGFGTIETGEIVVVLDPKALTGVRMSLDDALKFASALIQAVIGPEIEEPRRAGG